MADISQWATTAAGNDTGSTPDFPIEGMAPSAVNDTMRTNMAAIKRWYDDLKGYGLTTAGTSNAYTLTTTTTHAALTDQSLLVFEADRANTGSATLNVDGLGAKTIKKNGSDNLVANDIKANQVVIVAYENTADVYHLLSPPDPADRFPNVNADVTATDEELNTLDGVTATTAEINKLDGVTSTTAEINKLDGVTATTAEINKLDGVTATTAELNNADADTSGGGFLIGPTSSSDPGLAFDTWRTPNANRTTFVAITAKAGNSGVSAGTVTVEVDESGGTTADDTFTVVHKAGSTDDNFFDSGSVSFIVPAGGAYQVVNSADPDTENAITAHREWTL